MAGKESMQNPTLKAVSQPVGHVLRDGRKDIIFRTFHTYKKFYVYDRHTNSVIAVDRGEYEELREVEAGKMTSAESGVIAKYQKQGMFQPNVVKELCHPQTDIVEHNANHRLTQLILQVTQQCNLRCEYCAYSGIYEGKRTHSSEQMSFDTAKKAMDFFFDHSIENPDVTIGFYGGEPLLEFELVQKCVEYAKNRSEGKRVRFGMTTNGTLLTGRRAKFIAENEFNIGISLDGSKEEHDACRKFPDGTGSFDIVMKHVKELSENYPEYTKENVKFFTTVNPYMDLGCVLEYFSASDIINDNAILFNPMVLVDLKKDIPYRESYFQVRSYEYIKTLFSMIGKLDKKYVSRLTSGSIDRAERLLMSLHRRSELGTVGYQGGPCMPGVLRLFVRCDGGFYPCEKVNENLDYYKIGSVDDGFYLDKMKNLLNVGDVTKKECMECWNLQQCVMCSSEIEFHGKERPCKRDKLEACKTTKGNTEFELYQLCVLKEFGYIPREEAMWQ